MSDWEAISERRFRWGFAADEAEAARRALVAGTDMEMVSTTYRDTLAASSFGRSPHRVGDR